MGIPLMQLDFFQRFPVVYCTFSSAYLKRKHCKGRLSLAQELHSPHITNLSGIPIDHLSITTQSTCYYISQSPLSPHTTKPMCYPWLRCPSLPPPREDKDILPLIGSTGELVPILAFPAS